jgi:hypothetical protein
MDAQELIVRKTAISENIVAFCRYLRQHGFVIGPAEEAEALRAIEVLAPYEQPEYFQLCLRTVLIRSLKDLQQFDDLFQQYWRELDKAVNSKRKDQNSPSQKKKKQNKPSLNALKNWLYNKPAEETEEIAIYSANEVLTKQDFSLIPEEDLWEVMQLIQLIAKSMANQLNRRYEKAKQTGALDLYRTLRINMRRGGEIMDLCYRKPKKNKQQIVLLCDVSKSMDLYSKFLIQFIYAFQNAYRRIETFVFSTSLYRVSQQLKEQDFHLALRQMADEVPGWSGGTNIGKSLDTFCKQYSSKLLNNKTFVIILSDGWDTGDTELLEKSMQQINAKAKKVIWLNPLAGNPDFEPTVQGMQAAMPYIDVFASAHNIDSLRNIARQFRRL